MRYVKTLAKASSGMSLNAEHSGRVMMTLESSPRPPSGVGKKTILLCWFIRRHTFKENG